MFVWRRAYQQLVQELSTERGRREILERQVITQNTIAQFLCARVNQLEGERAAFIEKLTQVALPVPQLTATPPRINPDHPEEATRRALDEFIKGGNPMFEDMGDDAANKQGLGWDEQGIVVGR